ncbi:MAG: DUF4397 domain-containing protein [Marinobacter sp.]|nr:DUF4397 domain-containing protein [Marinobacter sp.]
MNKVLGISAVLALSVGLYGCNSSSSTPRTNVSIIHASSDAPAVNATVAGQTIQGADYKDVARVQVRTGTRSVSVDARLPGAATKTVIGPVDLDFNRNTNYEIIAIGNVGDDSLEPLVLTDTRTSVPSSQVRLRVAHLSPVAENAAGGPVSVYLTAPGANLAEVDPAFSFSFKDVIDPILVDAGTYQIRVTPEGSSTVVYDSGEVALPGGANLLVGAVDNTFYGNAPISLLVLNNGQKFTDIPDVGSGAGLRAVHSASADAASDVDVYIDTALTASPTFSFSFGDTFPSPAVLGGYAELEEGTRDIKITPAGVESAAIEASPTLALGSASTVIAVGNGVDAALEALLVADNNRAVATAARLRVIHAAAEAPVVDVFLVPTGDTPEETNQAIANASPTIPGFAYKENTGYLDVPAGEYVVVIRSGDGNELFRSGEINLSTGRVYTAIARLNKDPDSVATVVLLDDFNLL